MSAADDIEALFEAYLSGWNARDFSGMASLFTEPTIYMGAEGPFAVATRSDLEAMLRNKFTQMEADGFDHTEIRSIAVQQCDDTTAFLEMNGIHRLRGDGSVMDALDAIYICAKTSEGWRLSVVLGAWLDWRHHQETRATS